MLGSSLDEADTRARAGKALAMSNQIWACPQCQRRFTRKSQRHACGTGDLRQVFRDRPAALLALYMELAVLLNSLGQVEIVARERYLLFRSTRIFADLTVMTDSLRLVIHLPRQAEHPLFEKVVSDTRHVSHVVKLRGSPELQAMEPFLREAYRHSLAK